MHTALRTVKGNRLPVLSIVLTFLMVGWVSVGWGQTNISGGWDVSSQTNFGTSPLVPTNSSSGITIGSLTKGNGIANGGTAASRAWGGGSSSNWNTASATSIANAAYITFTVAANSGYVLSLNAITTLDFRISGTGPTSLLLQYTINNGTFTDIRSYTGLTTSSSGGSIGTIDLSGISALQNLSSSSIVTFRLVPYGANPGGTWYIFDKANSSANDLAIAGTVISTQSISTGAITPTTSYCVSSTVGVSVSVPYTTSGTFNSGNSFTAQLSNSTGSFASPTNIGNIAGTSSGTINATIPAGTIPSTAYRIRVISSNPSITGGDNGSNLTVNSAPSTLTVSPISTTICTNTIKQINVSGGSYIATATSGTGTSTTTASSTTNTLGPNPFQTYYGGAKEQILYTASELIALGLISGSQISALDLQMATVDNTYGLSNLKVKMQLTTLTSLSTFVSTNWTTVYSSTTAYLPNAGFNNLPFSTNFTWDGTSNLLIEMNYSNANNGTTTAANTAYYSTTSNTSTLFYRVDNVTSANMDAYSGSPSFTYTSRNNLKFTFTTQAAVTWTPITNLYTNAIATTPYTSGTQATTVYAKPTSTITYTATATANGCTTLGTSTINIANIFSGTGNWSNAGNWSCGVPVSGQADVLQIAVGANPTLDVSFDAAGSLTFADNTSSLIVGAGKTLTVSGSADFKNGHVTFKSDATGTASLGQSSTVSNATNVTVERFIPARRAFRYLTAPLSNAGSVFKNWQNNGSTIANTGVEIWRPGGMGAGTTGDGMTNAGASPSIQHFDSSQNKFINITNTKAALLSGNSGSADNLPYAVFVTGPYGNSSVITGTPVATTLSATGKLQTGNQTFTFGGTAPNLTAGNYILLPNPYASAVDATKLTNITNLDQAFYAWDPNISTRGGYVTVLFSGGTVTISPSSPTTAQTQNIESGQAVLVRVTNSGTSSVTFTEASKTAGGASVFREANTAKATVASQLRVTLNRKDAVSGLYSYASDVVATFNKVYSKTNKDDAYKLYGYDENMSLVYNNAYFAILRRPFVAAGDTLYLNIDYLKQNTGYNFVLRPKDFGGIKTKAFLVDNYLNTKTAFALTKDSVAINFTTTADAGSYNAKRFMIVFKPATTTSNITTPDVITKQQAPDNKAVLTVFPNPVVSNIITAYIGNVAKGKYSLVLYDNAGQQLQNRQVTSDGLRASYTLPLPASVISGTYMLVLKDKNGKQWQQSIVVQH